MENGAGTHQVFDVFQLQQEMEIVMIMSAAAVTVEKADSRKLKRTEPELSLNEIAALLRGELPVSDAPACLDQLPFIPVRNKASDN
jgi:hypothetical protein